ncbi:hypothetical protein scyTo_0003971 [Scyliorhinus torazame]|uniref:Phosvitin n=1 Tax=Scyliorhinus torazame TaxID=75743 RepID=A0A401NIB8_SCYTO|nr:hypothetical protein [Scyliorhinus torazame]
MMRGIIFALAFALVEPSFSHGKTYVYQYEGVILTGLPENGLAKGGLKITSKVQIGSVGQRKHLLKIISPQIQEYSGIWPNAQFIPARKLTRKLNAQLSKPIEFDYSHGRVGNIYAQADLPENILNIYRGILNMLQISIKKSQNIYELQEKGKNLRSVSTYSYAIRNTEGEAVIIEVVSKETHQFTPFNELDGAAITESRQHLVFLESKEQSPPVPTEHLAKRGTLRYQFSNELQQMPMQLTRPSNNDTNKIATALENLIQMNQERAHPDAPRRFLQLIQLLRSATLENLQSIWEKNARALDHSPYMQSDPFLRRVTLLAYGTLVNKYCATLRVCPDEALRPLHELVVEAGSRGHEDETILGLKAIGNAGQPSSLKRIQKLLPGFGTVAGSVSNRIHIEAVLALRNIAKKEPRKVQAITLQIFMNKRAPGSLRMKAFIVLLETQPSLPLIVIVADTLSRETNIQVTSFAYSYMKSLAGSSEPELQSLCLDGNPYPQLSHSQSPGSSCLVKNLLLLNFTRKIYKSSVKDVIAVMGINTPLIQTGVEVQLKTSAVIPVNFTARVNLKKSNVKIERLPWQQEDQLFSARSRAFAFARNIEDLAAEKVTPLLSREEFRLMNSELSLVKNSTLDHQDAMEKVLPLAIPRGSVCSAEDTPDVPSPTVHQACTSSNTFGVEEGANANIFQLRFKPSESSLALLKWGKNCQDYKIGAKATTGHFQHHPAVLVKAQWDKIPQTLKETAAIVADQLAGIAFMLGFSERHQKSAAHQISVIAAATSQRTLDVVVKTPKHVFSRQSIQIPAPLPFNVNSPSVQQRGLLVFADLPDIISATSTAECTVVQNQFTPFTKDSFEYQMPEGCAHVLVQDCTPELQFITLIRRSAESLVVQLYLPYGEIEIQATTKGKLQLFINRTRTPIASLPFSGLRSLVIERSDNGLKIKAPELGLEKLSFDGKEIKVAVVPWMAESTCGLCGRSDSQRRNEYPQPNKRSTNESLKFAHSWLLPGENCKDDCKLMKRTVKLEKSVKIHGQESKCYTIDPVLRCQVGCSPVKTAPVVYNFHCLPADSHANPSDEQLISANFGQKSEDLTGPVEAHTACSCPSECS